MILKTTSELDDVKVSLDELRSLVVGSSILGSGGGGNPRVGYMVLKTFLSNRGISSLEYTDQVSEEDHIVCAGGMGSPLVGVEKIPSGHEYVDAVKSLMSFLKVKFTKISPVEIGGINSVVPFIPSSVLGIPLLDGDGEGRAFPDLDMTTFHFNGIRVTPMSIVDERGNQVILDTGTDTEAEKVARAITVRFGGRGYVALYPMGGAQYVKSAIKGSISRAMELGKVLLDGGFESLLQGYGSLKFHGKVADIRRTQVHGFHGGLIRLEGLEENKGEYAELFFRNEYLVLKRDRIVLTSPEMISLLDGAGNVVTSDSIKYGMRVNVVHIPVDRKWKEVGGYQVIKEKVLGEYMALKRLDSEVPYHLNG
jgi:Uncharacterized conserved protein